MEQWDVYTADRQKTGRLWTRGTPHTAGDYHMTIHVCVFNAKGEMLVQQRQPFKSGWPNMWDVTVGGSAISGDTSQIAAQRELSEEIGLDIDFTGIRPHLTIPFEIGFDDYYLVEQEVDLTTLTLQEEEVQRVAWMTEETIVNGIEEGWFIGYHKSLIRLLFALRHSYGAHNEA